MEHKLGVPCASSGTVKCNLRLGKGGYIPGEKVHIWASISNNSNVEIKSTEAILTEVRHYFHDFCTEINNFEDFDFLKTCHII